MTRQQETLIGLVERYSPSGSESTAVGWLVERMHALGYSRAFCDDAGNSVGILGDGPGQIVLLGHIDTVPGEIPVRVENGLLFGRGSVDAKGPLAAFVDAAARIGPVPGWQIVVIGAVEEERESDGARYVSAQHRPRFAVVGEPSGWDRITLGYRGILRFRIRAQQAIGHSAAADAGACGMAVECWNRLVETCRRENDGCERRFDQLGPFLGGMRADSDGFTERAVLEGNIRLPLRISPEKMTALLRDIESPGVSVEPFGTPLPAFRAEKTTPLVGALLAGIRSSGGVPGFNLKLGTSDISLIGPAWNCPMAVYGPGDSALDHTPDECISLEEYDRAIRVLQDALKRVMTPHR
jgi:LysW-gamma-L-lysine carboxypeptidase